MSEIVFVRHGQASFGGPDYDRLSQLGGEQAAWLGAYFAERGEAFDRIVCGTLRRHHDTASGIARSMPRAPDIETLPGLDEFDFIAILAAAEASPPPPSAANRREFFRHLKSALLAWTQDALPGPVPETWAAFRARVDAAMADIRAQDAARTLVVSSGGPIGAIVATVLDAPAHTAIELDLQIRNTAITRCVAGRHALRVMEFNSVPHLDTAARRHAITWA